MVFYIVTVNSFVVFVREFLKGAKRGFRPVFWIHWKGIFTQYPGRDMDPVSSLCVSMVLLRLLIPLRNDSEGRVDPKDLVWGNSG